jgi:tetrameric-type glycyl-tRNA synthetase beta subunit
MVEKRDLLIEVGTEELPPLALLSLVQGFRELFAGGLEQHALSFGSVEHFATPRRLALRIGGLDAAQPDQEIVRRGPSESAAFDAQGHPTKAALGFARSCGVEVSELGREETEIGCWLSYRSTQQGRPTTQLLPDILRSALSGLPVPKRMRWGNLESEFVRPVHWVVILFGRETVECDILEVHAGRETRGHRFHRPGTIELTSPSGFEEILREQGWVEPVFELRRSRIREQAEEAARKIGAHVRIDAGLLDEVTSLTEWPVAILGSFDADFLDVPPEVLIETMQKHQKYFPIVDSQQRLLPKFVAISNIESKDPAQVRSGNERVIRPRFKDAAFFWEQDLKRPLAERVNELSGVVFQQKLGTLLDRAKRMALVSGEIARQIDLDQNLASRAALLCKCDLLSDMVGEFASLQGTMGRYYSQASGEDPCVSAAMEEHYLPRHSGDRLPVSKCGQAVALADKLDSLVGIFAIGQRPTGVKDPYALRRAALGILRILIETPLELDLEDLLQASARSLTDRVDASTVTQAVFDYMMERLKGYYSERQVSADVVDAVLARRPTMPRDIDLRVQAVVRFRYLPEAQSLSAANKRLRNILRKSQHEVPNEVRKDRLQDDHERRLYRDIERLRPEVESMFARADYVSALGRLATLRESVDGFFDHVMVMCEDADLRANRLALLGSLSRLFEKVADLSRLQ